jgi:hypothetical protein
MHTFFFFALLITNSSVAESVLGLVKGYASALAIDLCFLLEGQAEEELPEEILGSFRVINPELRSAKKVSADPNPELTRKNREEAEKFRSDVETKAEFEQD